MTNMGELEILERAERMLAQVASAQEAVDLVDLAAAARVYAQKAKLGAGAVNHATTVRLRAERKLAEIVDAGQANGQIATRLSAPGQGIGVQNADTKTLSELGVNRRRLAESRRIRDHYTDAQIMDLAADRTAHGKELTRTEVVRTANTAVKARRVEHLTANAPPVLSSLTQFSVLYADPPWTYDASSTPDNRKIENHYPTMHLNQICGLPVPAADDAILYLWATSPKLQEALTVMGAWGFLYRTCMVWVKDRIGMGYYARQRHELLLIGKRGNMPTPLENARPDSVIQAPRGEHSAKPDVVYELIERMYPGLAYCELFQRRSRAGWVGWGNEVPNGG